MISMGRAVMLTWLVVVWVALWGSASMANLLSGILVAAVLIVVFPLGRTVHVTGFRPLALLRFAVFFVYKVFEANLIVAWEVLTYGSRINQGIVAVPLISSDEALMTLLGNTISLTPGTLTLEARMDPPTLYVHVLHVRDLERTRADLQHLERLMLAAFAPDLVATGGAR